MPGRPDGLRRQAARFRARAEAVMARARVEAQHLISRAEEADLLAVELERLPVPRQRTGPKLVAKGPISVVAVQLGLGLADVAEEIDEKYATVRTWDKRGVVPATVAAKLQALLQAPPSSRARARAKRKPRP